MATKGQGISEVVEELRENKKWMRLQGLETLSDILEDFDDKDLVMYEEADGNTSLSEIGDKVDLGTSALSSRFSSWQRLGIVEKEGRQWKKIASLNSLGIDVPDLEGDD